MFIKRIDLKYFMLIDIFLKRINNVEYTENKGVKGMCNIKKSSNQICGDVFVGINEEKECIDAILGLGIDCDYNEALMAFEEICDE